jgi:lysophospholipase L1-like esterase
MARARRGRRTARPALGALVAALLLTGSIGCGDSSSPSDDGSDAGSGSGSGASGPVTELGDGPVTLVALGDSLTAGDGDDSGQGYVGRLAASIAEAPGREGSTPVNLGQSGWDSTMLVEGQEGVPSQLSLAVDEIRTAAEGGGAVLATVLIGSNDLWYVYEYGPPDGTPRDAEDAAADLFRQNLERAVDELQEAGAVVVLGLPDDQSLRPGVADLDRLAELLPGVTAEEVEQMSALAGRLGDVVEEVAEEHGLRTVDTNDAFWADQSRMADDGIHPNGDGYAALAALWLEAIEPML